MRPGSVPERAHHGVRGAKHIELPGLDLSRDVRDPTRKRHGASRGPRSRRAPGVARYCAGDVAGERGGRAQVVGALPATRSRRAHRAFRPRDRVASKPPGCGSSGCAAVIAPTLPKPPPTASPPVDRPGRSRRSQCAHRRSRSGVMPPPPAPPAARSLGPSRGCASVVSRAEVSGEAPMPQPRPRG